MVIKGRSRSNGAQLANYLLQNKDNDRTELLEIRGTAQPHDLSRSLIEMSLSSQLTQRGEKGLYHAQINPAIGEDRPMTTEEWKKAADMLEKQLGYDGQKRAIVLHEKKGRVHGHVVWERYDCMTGTLRSDSLNYRQHDKARAEIEQILGHERTPQKRKQQKELNHKERLTALWQQNPEGNDFIKAARDADYYVARKDDRRPFRVITPDCQSIDLIRQLDGVKTKEVLSRLQTSRSNLYTEAEALIIAFERHQNAKIDQKLSHDMTGSQIPEIVTLEYCPRQNEQNFIWQQDNEQPHLINEKAKEHKLIDPITGQEISEKEYRRLKVYKELEKSREQRVHDRDGYER